MPLSPQNLANFLYERDNQQLRNWTVAVGSSSNSLSVIQNADGSNPFVRSVSLKDNSSLVLLPNYQLDLEYFTVALVGVTPNPSAQWWVNLSDGGGYQRVKFVDRHQKALGSYWQIRLSGKNLVTIAAPNNLPTSVVLTGLSAYSMILGWVAPTPPPTNYTAEYQELIKQTGFTGSQTTTGLSVTWASLPEGIYNGRVKADSGSFTQSNTIALMISLNLDYSNPLHLLA